MIIILFNNLEKQTKIQKNELILGVLGSAIGLIIGLIILILFIEYNLNSYMLIGPMTVIVATFLGIITTIIILRIKPKIGGIILILIAIWLLINLTVLGTFSAILLFLTSYYALKRSNNDETQKRNKLKNDSFFFGLLGSSVTFTMGIMGLFLITKQIIEPSSLYWFINAIIISIIGFIVISLVIISRPKVGGIMLILISIWLICIIPIYGILGGILLMIAGVSELIKNDDITCD